MTLQIDILHTGYAVLNENPPPANGRPKKFMKANGSCCLVRSSDIIILFDTMGPWERNLLLQRLESLRIHPDDVDYLVCSHSHPDHVGNLNLFTKAKKHFVGTSVYSEDEYDLNCFEPISNYSFKSSKMDRPLDVIRYEGYNLATGVTIEATPGHTNECVSLILENCDKLGTVALAGDLFENENDITDESIWLSAGSQNPDVQRANRDYIFRKVDYILPGHGGIFKTSGDLIS